MGKAPFAIVNYKYYDNGRVFVPVKFVSFAKFFKRGLLIGFKERYRKDVNCDSRVYDIG
jgi:hypothetical protein